ncbi:hypothetical protein TIFTF001_016749 [Ficus carica]|uniref:Uncharacterized protein n=1 Tax=Ficus carica TaxID=3494 RepID=A0AA88ATN6_FICCA|nr:hypothetical protein TIFTF001_016749 [Ficus carica]
MDGPAQTPTAGLPFVVRGPSECEIRLSKLSRRSCSYTSYGWLGFSVELTQVQLRSMSSIGTSLRDMGPSGVRDLPKQTLWTVLLGHLLWLAWVFLKLTQGQLWSASSNGTSFRGSRTTEVRGLPKQTLWTVLLGNLLRLARNNPRITLVDVQHWDLPPWSSDLWSAGPTRADFVDGPAQSLPMDNSSRCLVLGPPSVVLGPPKWGGLPEQTLSTVLLGHLLWLAWVSLKIDPNFLDGPARPLPMIGLGFPYNNPRTTLSNSGWYPALGPPSVVHRPPEYRVYPSRLCGRSYSVTSYGWLGFILELTQVQLWSVSSIGTSLRGPKTFRKNLRTTLVGVPHWDLSSWSGDLRSAGITHGQLWSMSSIGTCLRGLGISGVGGLPEQTLWTVLLGHLLWLACVSLKIDPSPTLVGFQHWDLHPWAGDFLSAGIGTSHRGLGTSGVRGLPEKTMWTVLLRYFICLAWVFLKITQGQLCSVSSIRTPFRGPRITGVRGLPEQTLWTILLGHLLRLAWVFLRIDPSPTLVGI